jgi:DNA-binding transcriptional regulator GbsR (MarR family)
MSEDVIILSEKQYELVEQIGVLFERKGMTPASARVTGVLLVSDKTELSFDQIREILQLSKSATSNAINSLLNTEYVDYITKPGDRKRYFIFKLEGWQEKIMKEINNMGLMADLFKAVLKQRPGDTLDFNSKFNDIIEFTEFIRTKANELIIEWKEKQNT